MADAQLEIALYARNKADAAFNEVKAHLMGLERAATLVKGAFAAMAGAVSIGALTAGIGQMTGAASDLEETISKVNTLFGREMADDMERWAETAASSMGLAKQEALDAAGTMGNMFLQLKAGIDQSARLSQEMVQLSADIASFHNVAGGANQVLEAMQAAFRGEYDSLQRFIPTINAAAVEHEALARSGKKSKDELTALDKATGAYHIILRDAGAAAGDFSRTSDGLANQQRILTSNLKDLSAELGEVFIPNLTKSIRFLNDLAENKKFIAWLKLIGVTIDGFILEPMRNAIGMLSQATEYQADVLRRQIEKQKELIAQDMADLGGWRAKIMGADVYQEQLERHNRELEQMRRKLEQILDLSPMYIDIAAVPAAANVDVSGGPAPGAPPAAGQACPLRQQRPDLPGRA